MNINQVAELNEETEALVNDLFVYHAWDDAKVEKGKAVREALAAAVKVIIANVPPSPDREVAIRKIREARMDCNSSLTFDGKY